MKKDKTKGRIVKAPSLFRQLISIYYEQAQRRKALRLLEKQSWSYDFLSYVLVQAGKQLNSPLSLEIINKDGTRMILSYDKAKASASVQQLDDSILNHLDDTAAINSFIRQHTVR